MSENLRLTKKQVAFLLHWTEESSPEEAAKSFARLMITEGIDPSDMDLVIDKIMKVVEKRNKK